MTGQFRQYAPDIILRPFGGYTSIPFKYEIAKDPEKMYSRFRKPIVILYFGDCDKAGFEILESSVFGDRGLQKWCAVPFEVVRCGLTQEQAEAFEVPENPEKPGDCQWEALTDQQAATIIQDSLSKYLNYEAIEQVKNESEELNAKIGKAIKKAFAAMQ